MKTKCTADIKREENIKKTWEWFGMTFEMVIALFIRTRELIYDEKKNKYMSIYKGI